MNLSDIFSAVFDVGLAIKNFRLSIIFKGQDFSQASSEELDKGEIDPITLLSNEERENIEKNEVLEKIWNKWDIDQKKFYIDLKKGKTIQDQVLTESDQFLQKLRDIKYIGWIIAPICNISFGPTLGVAIGVIAAAAIIFTPLGYTVGAIGVSLALLSVGYETYRLVSKYRALNHLKEEYVLLEEIKKVQKEIELTRSVNNELYDRMILNTMFDRIINPVNTKSSLIDSAGYILQNRAIGIGWGLGTSIVTLSPIAILINLLGIVSSSSAQISMHHQYNKRFVQLNNVNAINKAELGLDRGKAPGQDINYMRQYLSDLRAFKKAVGKTFESEEAKSKTPNIAMVRETLLQNFNAEPNVITKVKEPSFFSDTWKILVTGISWTKVNLLFTPTLMQKDHLDSHNSSTYEGLRDKAINMNSPSVNYETILSVETANKTHYQALTENLKESEKYVADYSPIVEKLSKKIQDEIDNSEDNKISINILEKLQKEAQEAASGNPKASSAIIKGVLEQTNLIHASRLISSVHGSLNRGNNAPAA